MEQLVVAHPVIENIFGSRPKGVQYIIVQFQIDECVFCILRHFASWNLEQNEVANDMATELSVVSIDWNDHDGRSQRPVVCSVVETFAQNVQ